MPKKKPVDIDAIAAEAEQKKPSLGVLLKQVREEKKLEHRQVAKQTNIRESYIIAMEAGEYDKLPGPFFVRAYTQAYLRFLNISEDETVGYQVPQATEQPSNSAIKQLKPTTQSEAQASSGGIGKGTVFFMLLLCLAVLYGWQQYNKPAQQITSTAEQLIETYSDFENDLILVAKEDVSVSLLEMDGTLFEVVTLAEGDTHFIPLEPQLVLAVDDVNRIDLYVDTFRVDTLNTLQQNDTGWIIDVERLKTVITSR